MPMRNGPARRLSRRALTSHAITAAASAACAYVTAACRQKVIQVDRVVEVTKIVTEIVKETVVVERTRVETRVETRVVQAPTATPTPTSSAPRLSILGIDTPLTHHLASMGDGFEELFGVQATWRPLAPWRTYDRLVLAAHASGDLPDLIEAPSGALPARWRRAKAIQDLGDLVDSGAVSVEGILASSLQAFQWRGETLGFPYVVHGGRHLLGYHAPRFADLGVDPPAPDWPITRLATLDAGDDRDDAQGFAAAASLPEAYPLLALFGVRLFDVGGQPDVDARRLRVLLAWLKRMRPYEDRAPIELVEKGRLLATTVSLSQARLSLLAADGAGRIETMLFPAMPGVTQRAASAHAMGFCLGSHSSALDAAAMWCKYVSSREMGVTLFDLGLAAPGCRLASWTDTRVTDVMPLCAQIADELNEAQAPSLPASLDIEALINAWNSHTKSMLDGRLTVEQCVSDIQLESERIASASVSQPD